MRSGSDPKLKTELRCHPYGAASYRSQQRLMSGARGANPEATQKCRPLVDARPSPQGQLDASPKVWPRGTAADLQTCTHKPRSTLPEIQLVLVQLDAGTCARLDPQVPPVSRQRPRVHCHIGVGGGVGREGRDRGGRCASKAAGFCVMSEGSAFVHAHAPTNAAAAVGSTFNFPCCLWSGAR